MRPLLAIVSGAALALAVATDLALQEHLLNGAVATAWAKQDRDQDHDREEREDRDKDKDKDRDEDTDRGKDHNEDKDRDRDEDQGRGHGSGSDDQGDHDKDEESDNDSPDVDNPPSGSPDIENPPSESPGEGDPGGSDIVEIADREAEPAERGTENERDGEDAGRLAGRFDLDETEMFDSDGFLARRGEIIALSTNPTLARRAAALGLQVASRKSLPSLNTSVYRLLVPAGSPIDGILARLRADEPDGVFDRNHLYESSASRVGSGTISSVPPRALVSSGAGVTIGLIDTGVDVLNPASRGGLSEMRYFVDESRVLPETHGTAIVSLLASRTGLLPGAQLYIACVFYEDRRGGLLSEAGDLVRGLDWLMERRAPVINMSLSGPPNEVLQAAIARALGAGHLIVAAVGNSGPASPPLYPAAYEGVIAVTAVDSKGHVYRRANRGPYVEFAALGVDVVAAAPDGLATYSGSSFASPYVAALAALEYRSLDPRQAIAVRERLRSNARDLGKPGRDEIYGFGLAQPPTISTAAR